MSVSLARLQRLPTLAGFSEEELRDTARRLEPLVLEPHQDLDTSRARLWLVLEGQLGLEVGSGERFQVAVFHQGCVLSSGALLAPRGQLTVRERVLLAHIDEDAFQDWLAGGHRAALRLQHQLVLTLVRELRTANTCLVHLGASLEARP